MRRDRKSNWEGEQWIVDKRRREIEEGKKKDKRIVMVKLLIQGKKKHNKKYQVQEPQKV
jgi:hypothetical protein